MSSQLVSKKIISLDIIQTIIMHSDDSYMLRIALTEKVRDLLSCRLVVFVQNNFLAENTERTTIEYAPDIRNRNQLLFDILSISDELKKHSQIIGLEAFHSELSSLSKFEHTILIPIRHKEHYLGTLLLFDVSKLFDQDVILDSFTSIVPYISMVLYNTMSYTYLENIINSRTQELNSAIHELDDANRAKSMFLANMSHEMRTPLNGILGYTELLRLYESDSRKTSYLNKIDNASKSLLHLISEILDFSKIQYDNIELYDEVFSVKKALEDAIELHVEKAVHKGIELHVDTDEFSDYKVIGDIERFKQIINNLVSNAIKFTDCGSVDISVESQLVDIQLDDEVVGRQLKLTCDVADTGIGIQTENQQRIFDVFSQEDSSTTRKFGGTGLGLSIARRLAQMMNGDIKVESQVGSGSVFSFYVYFSLAEAEDMPTVIALPNRRGQLFLREDTQSYAGLRVLIVEDNELNRDLLEEILELAGIRPDLSHNGKEAVDQVIENEYDLIFMDCQMPVMDGYKATEIIKSHYKGLNKSSPVIIALTASVSEEQRQRCYLSGMDDYIPKPMNMQMIHDKITYYSQKLLDTYNYL